MRMLARVVTVTSATHHIAASSDAEDMDFERRPYSSIRGYASSKLYQIYHCQEIARHWSHSHGVWAYSVHPGVVYSPLWHANMPWWLERIVTIANPCTCVCVCVCVCVLVFLFCHLFSFVLLYPSRSACFSPLPIHSFGGLHYFCGLWFVVYTVVVLSFFLRGPREGAQTVLYGCAAAELENVSKSGAYLSDCAVTPSSAASMDADAAKMCWKVSLERTQLLRTNAEKAEKAEKTAKENGDDAQSGEDATAETKKTR
jgi:hypothetical protein